LILVLGLGGLLFVPIFKSVTHLPPYLEILLVLSLVWSITELIHRKKESTKKSLLTPAHALSKTDTPGILFFLGILLAVSALETAEVLKSIATFLNSHIGNQNLIVFVIGIASAGIDNVPCRIHGNVRYTSVSYGS